MIVLIILFSMQILWTYFHCRACCSHVLTCCFFFLRSLSIDFNLSILLQQIWWSSPLSGPKRFEYDDSMDDSNDKGDTDGHVWFCTQTGLSLVPLLAQELSHVLKTEITLEVDLDY